MIFSTKTLIYRFFSGEIQGIIFQIDKENDCFDSDITD